MESADDNEDVRGLLNGALATVDKLKEDAAMEHEVSVELARRNDALRLQHSKLEEQLIAAKIALADMDIAVRSICAVVDVVTASASGKDGGLNDSSIPALRAARGDCLSALDKLKETLLSPEELNHTVDPFQTATMGIATGGSEAQKPDNSIHTRSATDASHFLAAQTSPTELPVNSDSERSRSESIVGEVRGRNMSISSSMKPRRNSSIFVRLPENTGTSLIRKTVDPDSALYAASIDMGEGGEPAPGSDRGRSNTLLTAATASVDETLDISMDLNISRFPALNDSALTNTTEESPRTEVPLSVPSLVGGAVATPAAAVHTAPAALFEHFIVVGASEEVATEFAYQLQLSYDEGTLSNMFKNTFGTFFNSSRTAAGAGGAGGAPAAAAGGGQASGGLARQASGPAATTAGRAEAPTNPNAAVITANRRQSFGAGRTSGADPGAAGGGADSAHGGTGRTASADNATAGTPVRAGGMFSYFMRSPQGSNANTSNHSSDHSTTPSSSVGGQKPPTAGAANAAVRGSKGPISPGALGVKSTELDPMFDIDAFSVPVEAKPRPPRRFIYGDDSSDAGSNSSHGSPDLLSAAGALSPILPGGTAAAGTSPKARSVSSDGHGASEPSPIRPRTGSHPDLEDHDLMVSPTSPAPTFSSRFGEAVSSFYSTSAPKTPSGGNPGSGSGMASGTATGTGTGAPVARTASTDSTDSLAGYFFGGSPTKGRRDAPEPLPQAPPASASAAPPATTNTTAPPPPVPAPLSTTTSTSTMAAGTGNSTKPRSAVPSPAGTNQSAGTAVNQKPPVSLASYAQPTSAATDPTGLTSPAKAAVSRGNSSNASGLGVSRGSSGLGATVPYVSNPHAAQLIAHSDKKIGLATTKAEILFRYPPNVEPPPQEVSDFCMPLGGKISKLSDFDSGTTVQEILFGHSHSKRSGRCFIFLLEDKTLSDDAVFDEETGIGANRLYGICVLHPRLVKTAIANTKRKNPLAPPQPHASAMDASVHPVGGGGPGAYNGTAGTIAESEFIEFESMVCYAFITRFPLFDFFFQVIFDLINTERLMRMELAAEHADADLLYSRAVYQYLPQPVLEEVLSRLEKMRPPMHGEQFQFHISPGIKPIESMRVPPPVDFSEHYANSAEWALPTLLSWMPVETIVWAVSLLLSESKVVVVGHEYGMVSCAVIGLLVLLRPLDWVSPVIPMLPNKLLDFVESPVPILVGLTISSKEQTITVEHLFNRCSDPSNEGIVLSVLDVSKRELYLSADDRAAIAHLCMPGAHSLAAKLKECLTDRIVGAVSINSTNGTGAVPRKPIYTASLAQRAKTRAAHDAMTKHIASIADMATAHHQKLIDQRRRVIELADRMSKLETVDRRASFFGADQEGDDDSGNESPVEFSRGYGKGRSDNGLGLSAGAGTELSTSSTQPSVMAAAFGKVLRPRNSAEADVDSSQGGNPARRKTLSLRRTSVGGVAVGQGALGGGVAVPQGRLIAMSKQTLKGHSKEEFLNKFVRTQIFEEHLHRQSLVEATVTVITGLSGGSTTVPALPVATVFTATSTTAGAGDANSPFTATTAATATAGAGSIAESGNSVPGSLNGAVTALNLLSGARLPGDRTSGDSFPSILDSAFGSTDPSPRNSLILRRQSVDMGFLKASGKLTDHDPQESRDSGSHGTDQAGVTIPEHSVAAFSPGAGSEAHTPVEHSGDTEAASEGHSEAGRVSEESSPHIVQKLSVFPSVNDTEA